jgi:hypothetical protein
MLAIEAPFAAEPEGPHVGLTAREARRIATRWVAESGPDLTAQIYEFDEGFVVWGAAELDGEPPLGAGRGVIDRYTGEVAVWPSLPVQVVAERYRAERAELPRPRPTWDPLAQARRDLDRLATPGTITYLLLDGAPVTARSARGDGEPEHHHLVQDSLARVPAEFRERGRDRCSEVIALSDALKAEDVRRIMMGEQPLTVDEARTGLFRGAELVTYRVREPADPQDAVPGAPCLSCLMILGQFGFDIAAPEDGPAAGTE